MTIDIEFLKYPIGKFQAPEIISNEQMNEAKSIIRYFPTHLFTAVSSLSPAQLDTPYRPGGWTVRQVIHHCADSHMNALIRFKLAITESQPTVKPYDEGAWANLADYSMPVEGSLQLIQIIHSKWIVLLNSMEKADFQKTYFHPESKKTPKLEEVTLMYAWHSSHHLAHIQHLALRENWTSR
ncbi:YfiT family bacillithiol transferase [Algoriphagus confluentis]|uniref:Bacillithiol transferase BstA n=1 Tax=Algoriphagus confluentis TaxID=1697556 RepID=A0ABQ6PQ87_9BACT|nr:bacillithiol transferase BstA [Algoriphagus confluentis]